MSFEIETQVENRLTDHVLCAKKERNQQSTEPAVPVKERMNSLELDMSNSSFDQNRQVRSRLMKKHRQIAHAIENEFRGRWHEDRVAGPTTADPILASAKFTGEFLDAQAFSK